MGNTKPNQNSESEVTLTLRSFFVERGWDFSPEVKTVDGKYIDYVVSAPTPYGEVQFGVECKARLDGSTKLTEWADHFEQAHAYSKALDMPVFVGPYHTSESPMGVYHGGTEVSAVSAFCAIGGRANVGVLVSRHCYHDYFYLILRGASFWEPDIGFRKSQLRMVRSTGSYRGRRPISTTSNSFFISGDNHDQVKQEGTSDESSVQQNPGSARSQG